jgi:hypothetical protein
MKSPTRFTVGSVAVLLLGAAVCEQIYLAQTARPREVGGVPSPRIRESEVRASRPQVSPPALAQHAAASTPRENELTARDEGYRRIAALQESGEFERAASFAAEGAADLRRDWIIAAYYAWGKSHPEAAADFALELLDVPTRQLALQSVFSGWAHADPEGLAELALRAPEGPEKNAALTKAMREWLQQNPWKAGDWIAAHEDVIPVAEKMFTDDRR